RGLLRKPGQRAREASQSRFLLCFHLDGLTLRNRAEMHRVTGLELTNLPDLGLDDSCGADKAAEAGAVGSEIHRHIPGKIHCANGISIVVDVRGMQPRFSTVGTSPNRFWSDQPDAGAIGIVMH